MPSSVVTRPAKAMVTPADIHSSRVSATARADAKRRWPTSAAHTHPTARHAGTAAVGRSEPAPIATTIAMSPVIPQAPSRRTLTLTGARMESSGDIASIVTRGRWSQTRYFGTRGSLAGGRGWNHRGYCGRGAGLHARALRAGRRAPRGVRPLAWPGGARLRGPRAVALPWGGSPAPGRRARPQAVGRLRGRPVGRRVPVG